MACKTNQDYILKSTSAKIGNDKILVLALVYHTANKEEKENKTAKSYYKYIGRVAKIKDLEAEVESMKSDSRALTKWVWPTVYKLPEGHYMCYNNEEVCKGCSKWITARISKALDWSTFEALVKTGSKMTARGVRQSESAKYDLNDYILEDGSTVSINSIDDVLKLDGHRFYKDIIMKRDLD